MGLISASPELSLDLNPTFVPRTITVFLKEISKIGNVTDKSSKLDDFVKRLEEEMKKIDAFKRELPLCMLLLHDAIVMLKDQNLLHCGKNSSSSSCSEMADFISLGGNCGGDEIEEDVVEIKKEKDVAKDNKMNWMSSAQLWSSNNNNNNDSSSNRDDDVHHHEKKRKSVEKDEQDDDPSSATVEMNTFSSSSSVCKYKNGGGAFMPFKGFPSGFPLTMTMSTTRKEDKEVLPSLVPSLSLLTPGIKTTTTTTIVEPTSCFLNSRTTTTNNNCQSSLQNQQQPPRKQRRCWSPDLHRRFVSALQQLGGSQVATPKQIRELMKVDGLTNDEVKSHLQKYRLHTRRPPNASSTSPSNQQALVVLGGLWVSQDQYGTSKSNTTSQSESPQGPLQLSGAGGGVSTTGTTGDDSMEDERSESHSWEGHQQQKSGDGDTDA